MAAALTSAIKQEISKIIAAKDSDARYDPIMRDLLRLPGRPPDGGDETRHSGRHSGRNSGRSSHNSFRSAVAALSMENHSLLLLEHLHLISEPNLDDTARMKYEESLRVLINHMPTVKTGSKAYPNDYLSRVLLDNYQYLLKVTTSYFNLSLSSQITKYLVRLVYALECWEIYHLLLAIPNFDYFLRLLGFEVKLTSLGHMVRPPPNYLNFNLRQGLQYPFPFPFYNFSYHSVDKDSTSHKMKRVSFQSYIDLRLNKDKEPPARVVAPVKRRPGRPPKRAKVAPKVDVEPEEKHEDSEPVDVAETSETDAKSRPESKNCKSDPSDSKDDFQRHHKVFIFIHKTLDNIAQETQSHALKEFEDEDGYETDEAMAMMEEEKKNTEGDIFVPSIFQKVLNDYEKRGAAQAIHQCRLLNTGDNKPCMKVFYGKNELQRHQEFVHATTKRNYKCYFCQQAGNCNQSYPRHDSLARHIRRKHGITGKENKRAVMMAREDAEKGDKDSNADKDFVFVEEPSEKEYVKDTGCYDPKRSEESTFSSFSSKPVNDETNAAKETKVKSPWENSRPKDFSILGHMKNSSGSNVSGVNVTPVNVNPVNVSSVNVNPVGVNSSLSPETRMSYEGRAPQNFSSWLPPPKHYIQGPSYGTPHDTEMKRPEPSTYTSSYVPYGGFQPNYMPSYYKHPEGVYYGESVHMGMPMKGYPVQYPFVNTMYPTQYAGHEKPVHRHEFSSPELPLPRQSMYQMQPSSQVSSVPSTQANRKSSKERGQNEQGQ